MEEQTPIKIKREMNMYLHVTQSLNHFTPSTDSMAYHEGHSRLVTIKRYHLTTPSSSYFIKCSIPDICLWLIFLFLRENFHSNSLALSENVINKKIHNLSSDYHNPYSFFSSNSPKHPRALKPFPILQLINQLKTTEQTKATGTKANYPARS